MHVIIVLYLPYKTVNCILVMRMDIGYVDFTNTGIQITKKKMKERERDRDRERQRQRQTDRQTDRQRQRERETNRQSKQQQTNTHCSVTNQHYSTKTTAEGKQLL